MYNFCQHCGRQLQDGELQSADGCQYCAGRNKRVAEEEERVSSSENINDIDSDVLDSFTKTFLC